MKRKIVISVIIMFLIPSLVYAINVSDYNPTSPEGYSEFTNIGGNFISIIQYVGIILAVIVMTLMGIKYMLGSVEEKAEYKKSMMPYVVGCAFLLCSSVFVGIISDVVGNKEIENGAREKTETLTIQYINGDVTLSELTDAQLMNMYSGNSIERDLGTYINRENKTLKEAINMLGDYRKQIYLECISRNLIRSYRKIGNKTYCAKCGDEWNKYEMQQQACDDCRR